MHVWPQGFPISERIAGLSDQIGYLWLFCFMRAGECSSRWLLTICGCGGCNGLRKVASGVAGFGILNANTYVASGRQKRWGKRFQHYLADVAGQELGGPPHRASDLFPRAPNLNRQTSHRFRANLAHRRFTQNGSFRSHYRDPIPIADSPTRDGGNAFPGYENPDQVQRIRGRQRHRLSAQR